MYRSTGVGGSKHEDEAPALPRARAVRTWFVPLAACLFLGFVLRVVGLKFGLPNLYYWDEPTVVNRAVRFGSGDFNPHFFYYPALYMYVLFAAIGVYFAVGRATGVFHSTLEFASSYFIDPTSIYWVARFTTAIVGTLAIGVTFLVGARYFRRGVGLLGALFLAVSPLCVSYAHVAICDTIHALFICAACLPLYDVLKRARWRDYAFAGTLIGVGIASKYLAGLHVVTLCAAHLLRDEIWRERRPSFRVLAREVFSERLLLAGAAVGGAFFLGSPYNLLSVGSFVKDWQLQAAISAGGSVQLGDLLRVVPDDFGWPLCLFALIGLADLLLRPSRARIVFLIFPAIYGLALMRISKVFPRYLLPQSAFIAIIAAHGLFVVYDFCASHLTVRVAWVLFAGVVACCVSVPVRRSLSWDHLMQAVPDTRTVALAWVNDHIEPGSRVAVQSIFNRNFDNIPVVTDQTLQRLRRILPASGKLAKDRQEVLAAWQARPVYTEVPWGDAASLRKAAPRYVLLSSAFGPIPAELRAWLDSAGQPIKRFEASRPAALRNLVPGVLAVMPPTLTIYQLGSR